MKLLWLFETESPFGMKCFAAVPAESEDAALQHLRSDDPIWRFGKIICHGGKDQRKHASGTTYWFAAR